MGIPGSVSPRGMKSILTSGFPGATAVISKTAAIGSTSQDSLASSISYPNRPKVIITKRNPFTGKEETIHLEVLHANNKKGETVLRQSTQPSGGLSIDLGELEVPA